MGASELRDLMTSTHEPQWRRPRRAQRAGSAAPGPLAPVMELQRMAGNRAVTALLARDPKTKPPPAKPEAPKKPPPKQTYASLGTLDPIPLESVQLGTSRPQRTDREKPERTPVVSEIVITTF